MIVTKTLHFCPFLTFIRDFFAYYFLPFVWTLVAKHKSRLMCVLKLQKVELKLEGKQVNPLSLVIEIDVPSLPP